VADQAAIRSDQRRAVEAMKSAGLIGEFSVAEAQAQLEPSRRREQWPGFRAWHRGLKEAIEH